MIKIWCRSYCDRKNPHSMRLEPGGHQSTSLTIYYYSRKGKGRKNDKEGSGEKKTVPRQTNEKIGERQSAEIRYQNMKKQNPFPGKRKTPPRKYGKTQVAKAPNPRPNFLRKNKQSRLVKNLIVAWSWNNLCYLCQGLMGLYRFSQLQKPRISRAASCHLQMGFAEMDMHIFWRRNRSEPILGV